MLWFTPCLLCQNESAGIAASIDAVAAGEDLPEVSGNGNKCSPEGSPSVCFQFCFLNVSSTSSGASHFFYLGQTNVTED